MKKPINITALADSYKYSHFLQYQPTMISMFDYAEARSNKIYPKTLFFGLQYLIKEYLQEPITLTMVHETNERAKKHGIPFDLDSWTYIAEEYGYLPIQIRAVPEGMLIPTSHPLFTVESTDTRINVAWVVGFIETLLMKTWYPCNVATRSYYVKQMLKIYWDASVDEDSMFGINFAFHNFGDRGASSVESAGIGGVAHLTQFLGTDTFNALNYADEFYGDDNAGFSIPATEHSTTTSWGKENESDMIMRHIETNKGADIIAGVLDSYDYLKMVDVVTSGEFKEKIESDDYPKFVIRPDSGDPVEMIAKTLDIMEDNNVKYRVNTKGYSVFEKYGILWGDGIDSHTMQMILDYVVDGRGYSAEIISFGSGGWLMTDHDRDTQGWAIKCSSITLDEGSPIEDGNGGIKWEPFYREVDVFKDPITSPAKKSKKGKVSTFYNSAKDKFKVGKLNEEIEEGYEDFMQLVYLNGEIFNEQSLKTIRERVQ